MLMPVDKAWALHKLQLMLIKLGAAPKLGHIVVATKMDLGYNLRCVYWTYEDWCYE